MKLEKRNSEETPQSQEADKQPTGKKPVVVYIMILFIAAFLLMALSFLMHQRSNTEALGQLQNSVTAMQEVQATQEKIIELQDELAEANRELENLREKADAGQAELEEQKALLKEQAATTSALQHLYALQQLYSGKHYDSCLELIETMEQQGDPSHLPDAAMTGVTPPAERYQELKEAVEARVVKQG